MSSLCPNCGFHYNTGPAAEKRVPPPTDAGGETERARILELRDVAKRAARYLKLRGYFSLPPRGDEDPEKEIERRASEWYPLPPRTRPRVVRDPMHGFTQEWRAMNDRVEWRGDILREWKPLTGSSAEHNIQYPTTERIVLWANLLANPTEPVPEDEP